MAWKKSPKELTDFLDEKMKDVNCEKRKMFGFPAYFINGNMFTGTFEEQMFLRLSQKDREDIQGEHEDIKSFEPMKGRAMKEYVVVPKSLYENNDEYALWVKKSIEYVSSLHKKEKKKDKK
jgi:TfoX/Sxy family transcriptional regulator of competence genes